MKTRPIVVSVLLLLAAALPPASASPPTGLARSYVAPTDLAGWSGTVTPIDQTNALWLSASSGVGTGSSHLTVQSVARLQNNGSIDWALELPHGSTGQFDLFPIPNQPLVCAKAEGLPNEDFWSVFGVFDGRTGNRMFEFGIPVTVDYPTWDPWGYAQPRPTVQFLHDGRFAVLLEGLGTAVHLAIVDQEGQVQWERSLDSSAFAMAAQGTHSRLIEYPGGGFLLLVQGSHTISTAPNPPPINTAVTLDLVRLSNQGEVLWKRELAGLLTGSPVLTVQPTVVSSAGTLVLSLSDVIINTWGTPTLLGLVTYVVAVTTDGDLSWARRIDGIGETIPVLGPNQGALFLFAQRLPSPTAVIPNGVVLRLAMSTGSLLAQTSVNSSTAQALAPAGITSSQIFLQATTPRAGNGPKALVGSIDLALRTAIWRQFEPNPVRTANLSYSSKDGTLLFSSTPASTSRIDVITLDTNLNPIALTNDQSTACPTFSEVSIPMVDLGISVQPLVLTPPPLDLTVSPTDIPLLPSQRLVLNPIQPTTQDLCSGSVLPLVHLIPGNPGQWALSFNSESGRTYEVAFTLDLTRPFQAIETVQGDGAPISRPLSLTKDQNGFFIVRPVTP